MAKKKVISAKNIPVKLPIILTAVAFLYLDRYDPPGFVWGVSWTLLGLLWILCIISKSEEEPTDILK